MGIQNYYDVALNLVKQSGAYIRERINSPKDVSMKSCDVDLVTECDEHVEKLFMDGITKEFPDHKFIGEETTSSGKKVELTDAPTWVIDPIDGTMNFVHTFPHTCISVALLINKVIEIGIVYNPVLEQLFTAKKGEGAFFNGKRIKVSGEKDISKALVMIEMGTSRDPEKMEVVLENTKNMISKIHGMRTLGSAALNICMVALGGADANFEYGLHIWDFAAGDLIVREAGGVSMDPAGGPLDLLSRRYLCASSKELADQVSSLLVQYYPERD
ncbi:inositol monophosphatase 1-like [Chelonus insularis]|uniref:inositol monophosphatase 1-like n=1 Tax=Chelonus insularis TaxID=460826 RepID=UPI00158C22D4|nr:inositol monophosphatase 1-like [Chelonus insularis]XP_034938792.1 inositol monophosphatase 1-like [Chelonus insularis]